MGRIQSATALEATDPRPYTMWYWHKIIKGKIGLQATCQFKARKGNPPLDYLSKIIEPKEYDAGLQSGLWRAGTIYH